MLAAPVGQLRPFKPTLRVCSFLSSPVPDGARRLFLDLIMKATVLPLGLLFCSAVALPAQTIPASTAYDASPQHLWNQLNSTLFARVAPEGTAISGGHGMGARAAAVRDR